MTARNETVTKAELKALELKVDDVSKIVALHETRFAVRAESDKRIDVKFEHMEKKMDEQHKSISTQTSALRSALLKVAYTFVFGSASIIVGVVAFVMAGVVKIG